MEMLGRCKDELSPSFAYMHQRSPHRHLEIYSTLPTVVKHFNEGIVGEHVNRHLAYTGSVRNVTDIAEQTYGDPVLR